MNREHISLRTKLVISLNQGKINATLCYLHQHEFPQKLNFHVFANGVKIVQPKVAKNGGNPSV